MGALSFLLTRHMRAPRFHMAGRWRWRAVGKRSTARRRGAEARTGRGGSHACQVMEILPPRYASRPTRSSPFSIFSPVALQVLRPLTAFSKTIFGLAGSSG